MTNLCAYCGKPRTSPEGWHDCPGARDAHAHLDQVIEQIKRAADRPNGKPQTSREMKARADNRRAMANMLRIQGSGVRKEYDVINRTED
jgi:hypothetical protein